MANIPYRYTQEAQDSRDRSARLARTNATCEVWSGACFRCCINRGRSCGDCIRYSHYEAED